MSKLQQDSKTKSTDIHEVNSKRLDFLSTKISSKCLTEKQGEFKRLIKNKDIVITTGPAGTGKTYVALQTSLKILLDKNTPISKIVLCKSVTTIPREEIGFLPGDMKEKMEPFMKSYTANIDKIFGITIADKLLESNMIEIQPLAHVRGIQHDNAVIIVDEVQNIDMHTFKTIITRLGKNSKMLFLGDSEQIDLKKSNESCLTKIMNIFKDDDIVGVLEFTNEDCVRHPNIPIILEKLKAHGY